MSLEDINKKLHSRAADSDGGKQDGLLVTPGISALPTSEPKPASDVPLGEAWGGEEKHEVPISPEVPLETPRFRIPRKLAIGLGIVALISLAAGVFFKAGGWLFAPENVQITINGPKEADSNKIVEYTISFENNNWVDLEDAELIITYPTIFRFVAENGFETSTSRATLQLGTIEKSSLSSVKIKGSFQSLQDQVALITATLRAAPSGVTSKVDFENRYSIAVEGSSLIIDLSAPLQAGDGQFADYVVTYRNESAVTVENLELRLSYPEGFTTKELVPRPSRDDNVWKIFRLSPGESDTVTVRGVITGAQGDVKRVIAELGVPQGDGSLFSYADIVRQTKIIASPLVISQKINSETFQSAGPGEGLAYQIFFRNNGDVGLRDLIVTVDLDPKYFDVGSLELSGGTYNVQKKQVIFRASDRKQLSLIEPGQGGTIGFSVPVRKDLALYNQSNIEVESIAKIDSPDVPTPIGANKIIASNRVTFKVKTAPIFDLRGYHFDGYGNTGPVPLRVGQETQYTLVIRAGSTINSLEEAVVNLVLPGQARYIKTHNVTHGTVGYNDRTGELYWTIGTIAPRELSMAELAIQIGITPDPSQVGNKEIDLINSLSLRAKDQWTGEILERSLPIKKSNLFEDAGVQAVGGGEVFAQ